MSCNGCRDARINRYLLMIVFIWGIINTTVIYDIVSLKIITGEGFSSFELFMRMIRNWIGVISVVVVILIGYHRCCMWSKNRNG